MNPQSTLSRMCPPIVVLLTTLVSLLPASAAALQGSGKMTYYGTNVPGADGSVIADAAPTVNYGSCGIEPSKVGPNFVAMNASQYSGDLCGKEISIRNPANGQTTTGVVVDRCAGCPNGGLDSALSVGKAICPRIVEDGHCMIEWVIGGSFGGAPPAEPEKPEQAPPPQVPEPSPPPPPPPPSHDPKSEPSLPPPPPPPSHDPESEPSLPPPPPPSSQEPQSEPSLPPPPPPSSQEPQSEPSLPPLPSQEGQSLSDPEYAQYPSEDAQTKESPPLMTQGQELPYDGTPEEDDEPQLYCYIRRKPANTEEPQTPQPEVEQPPMPQYPPVPQSPPMPSSPPPASGNLPYCPS